MSWNTLPPKERAIRSLKAILKTLESDTCEVRKYEADIGYGEKMNKHEWNHVAILRIETARAK